MKHVDMRKCTSVSVKMLNLHYGVCLKSNAAKQSQKPPNMLKDVVLMAWNLEKSECQTSMVLGNAEALWKIFLGPSKLNHPLFCKRKKKGSQSFSPELKDLKLGNRNWRKRSRQYIAHKWCWSTPSWPWQEADSWKLMWINDAIELIFICLSWPWMKKRVDQSGEMACGLIRTDEKSLLLALTAFKRKKEVHFPRSCDTLQWMHHRTDWAAKNHQLLPLIRKLHSDIAVSLQHWT